MSTREDHITSPPRPGRATPSSARTPEWADRHVRCLEAALAELGGRLSDLVLVGAELGGVLRRGGRLLALGNGGSAAQAQHLTAELVGRYRTDRPALSAVSLVGDVAAMTALANDFGAAALFARQVAAHGRAGDVLVALSTSGRSPNVLAAVEAAHRLGMTVVALTGPVPNPLAGIADRCLAVPAAPTPTVQEVHQVMIHLLCDAIDQSFEASDGAAAGLAAALLPAPVGAGAAQAGHPGTVGR